jgi:hypothetical protein
VTNPSPTPEDPWQPFAGGSSIGKGGSDEGTITRDEAHPLGARITLECEPSFVPYAVTSNIYGWMVHTRYFATEAEAQAAFDQMKPGLAGILDMIPSEDDPKAEAAFPEVIRAVEDFVKRFPRVEQEGV